MINNHDAKQVVAFEYRHRNNGTDFLYIFRTIRIFPIGQNVRNVDRAALECGAGGLRYVCQGELGFALQTPLVAEKR